MMQFPSSLLLLVLLPLLGSCVLKGTDLRKGGDDETGPDRRTTSALKAMAKDVVAYANVCREELGIGKGVRLDPWNCLEGKEVPITIDGVSLDAQSYERLSQGEIGCDEPSWLSGCSNYVFVQKRQLTPEVVAVLLCRTRNWTDHRDAGVRRLAYERSGSEEDFRSLY